MAYDRKGYLTPTFESPLSQLNRLNSLFSSYDYAGLYQSGTHLKLHHFTPFKIPKAFAEKHLKREEKVALKEKEMPLQNIRKEKKSEL
jgi:hypothetical protein